MSARPRIRLRSARVLYHGRVFDCIRERLDVDGRTVVRDSIRRPGAVVIVPVLPGRRVVLVRQYRRAVRQWLLELPAGSRGRGERWLGCAKRELEEETGWRAARWERLTQYYAAPGFASEMLRVFLARDLRQVGACPEPDEMVTPEILPLDRVLSMIWSGKILDGKTVIGILMASRRLHGA